jgi:glucose-1-phosphate thymidylyltransferase
MMRGIVLAGGTGSRLWPVTRAISKQLMPVYDKPMIYYPLSTLIKMGITEILIITRPEEQEQFKNLLGSGAAWNIKLEYAVQPEPNGIAQAFIIGERFIGEENVALILGDNIFHGGGFYPSPLTLLSSRFGAEILAYQVSDPERYGVVDFDAHGDVLSIEEKPAVPRSRYAVPGLYFYDNDVVNIARHIHVSARGELEISTVNQIYLDMGKLRVSKVDRGSVWLDTGTFEATTQASEYVRVIEHRTGVKVGCIEEDVWRRGLIGDQRLRELAEPLIPSGYGGYLLGLLSK